MHIFILWTVLNLHTRHYMQAFSSDERCEHVAALMNKVASDKYDWVCLPATEN